MNIHADFKFHSKCQMSNLNNSTWQFETNLNLGQTILNVDLIGYNHIVSHFLTFLFHSPLSKFFRVIFLWHTHTQKDK